MDPCTACVNATPVVYATTMTNCTMPILAAAIVGFIVGVCAMILVTLMLGGERCQK